MSFVATFYSLGVMILTLSGGVLLPLLIASGIGETSYVIGFLSTLVLTAFFGGGLILGLRDMPTRSGMREAVFLIVLAWIVVPVFAAIPFAMGGATTSFTQAYFESVSALTTTGATLFANPEDQAFSILLWRSVLQWIGGFGAILMGVGIFSAISFSGLPIRRPPVKVQEAQHLLDRLRPVAEYLLSTYIYLTLACFLLIWVSGVSPFHALCLALSTISTGGFMSKNGSLSDYNAPGAEIFIVLFMIIGALNFVLHHDGLQGNLKVYRNEPEMRALLYLALFFGLVLFALTLGDVNISRHLFSSLFNAVSLLTTTGYAIGEGEPMTGVPLPFILAAVLIGGSAMSTAGGLKMIRLILLFRHITAELNRLAHPHSMSRLRYGNRSVSPKVLPNLWVYFICLTVLVGLVTIGLSLYGHDFPVAISAAVSALSNTGPALHYAVDGNVSYSDFAPPAQWIMIAAMVIGRIEILVVLPIFSPSYWQS